MSVLVVLRYDGDPDVLAAGYDVEMEHPKAVEQPARLSHTCVKRDGGLLVVDYWDDEASMRALMADPEFVANYQAAGLPGPSSVEVYAVHRDIR